MGLTIADIAAALGAECVGKTDIVVRCVAEPGAAAADVLAMAMDPRYAGDLSTGRARAALLWPGADWQALGLDAAILAPRARLAMAGVTRLFDAGPGIASGIHSTAVIDPTAVIGADAAIGPLVVIGAGASIGPRARIAAHSSVGEAAVIGADALLHAGVRIGARVKIGERFVAQPGAVIGADGFSFVTPEKSGVEEVSERLSGAITSVPQKWERIHSLGAVSIGDDVEIGANSCIDRGTIRDTEIGSGTKIDNLVQIGHNVRIGEDCLFCGMAAVAGSARIGNRVVFGGRAAVADNLLIGDDVILTGGSGVASNVPAGAVMGGTPAVRLETYVASYKALRRLPRFLARFSELQKAVSNRRDSD